MNTHRKQSIYLRFILYILVITFLMMWVHPAVLTVDAQNTSGVVNRIVWSPDGTKIAVGYQNGLLNVFSSSDSQELVSIAAHSASVLNVEWSPNGRYIASGGATPDNSLRVWDSATGSQVFAQSDVGFDVLAITWSSDSQRVLAVAIERSNSPNNGVVINLLTGQVAPVSFGSAGDAVWSSSRSYVVLALIGSVVMYDANSFEPISEYTYENTVSQPLHLSINADGSLIALGMTGGEVMLWNSGNPNPIATFTGSNSQGADRSSWITALQFSQIDNTLTSVAGDGTIRSWNTQDGILVSEQVSSANFAADLSPYGVQVALGLATVDAETSSADEGGSSLLNFGIRTTVVNATPERLNALAEQCDTTVSDVEDFIETLDTVTMPTGCANDLRSLATELQSQSSD